jgi:hypothetical protein
LSKTAINPDDSRVNVLLRLVGLLFLAIGAVLTYLTYEEALNADLVPQLVPVFYLCSGILIIAGFTAMIAKYRSSE